MVAILGELGVRAVFGDGVEPIVVKTSYVGRGVPEYRLLRSTLRVTWYKSTCPAWLCFDSEDKAHSAVATLNSRAIHGARLQAMVLMSGGFGRHNCVQADGVPSSVGSHDFETLLDPEQRPISISFGRKTYPAETSGKEVMRKFIKERTTAKIIHESHQEKAHPAKECVDFTFDGLPDLIPVTEALNERPFPELGNTRAYAEAHVHLVLKVKKAAYAVKLTRIDQVAAAVWPAHRVKVRAMEAFGDEEYAIVHLWAADRGSLALVKYQVETLFNQDDVIFALVKQKASKQTHRIRLTKTAAYKQAKENLEKAQKEFGEGVVCLDDKSDPPAIIVTGDSTVLRNVRKHFRGDKPTGVSKKISCDVCLDDDVNDIAQIAGCGHIACTECVRALFMTKTEAKFPLECFKHGCEQKISSKQVYEMLSQEELSEVLRDSILHHFRRHPKEFSRCPGAYCIQWYHRTEVRDRPRRCNACLTLFCAHCDIEYHLGESCAQYQERIEAEEREILRYLEATGAKRCPGCRTIVHKLSGCNNMDCGACLAHFCWVCLWIGETHHAVYGHLKDVHGGYVDDPQDALNMFLEHMGPEEAAANGLVLGPAAADGVMFERPAPLNADEALRRIEDVPLLVPNPAALRQIPANVAGRQRPPGERPQPHQRDGQRPEMPANVDPADLRIPREAAEVAQQVRNNGELDRMQHHLERDIERLRLEIPALPPFAGFPRQAPGAAQAAGQPRPRVPEHRPLPRNRQRQEAPPAEPQWRPHPQQGFAPGPQPPPDELRMPRPAMRPQPHPQQDFAPGRVDIERINEEDRAARQVARPRRGAVVDLERQDPAPAPMARIQFGELDAGDLLAERMQRVALLDQRRAEAGDQRG